MSGDRKNSGGDSTLRLLFDATFAASLFIWGLYPAVHASASSTGRISHALPKFTWFLHGSPSSLDVGLALTAGFLPAKCCFVGFCINT